MKKILAIIMTVVMICAATSSVSAVTINDVTNQNTASADVSVVYTDSTGTQITTIETIYSVDIKFGDLEFEWKATNVASGDSLVWNPTTHTYQNASGETAVDVSWQLPEAVTDAITVVNHSNANVAVTANFTNSTKEATANGFTAKLSENDKTLNSAAAVAYNNLSAAEQTVYTLTPSGEAPADPTSLGIAVGTITVTISAAN